MIRVGFSRRWTFSFPTRSRGIRSIPRCLNTNSIRRHEIAYVMRKIIEFTLVSLDGVIENPHLWATKYFDSEAEKYALELLSAGDGMLMGRRTYEFFAAAFPHQAGEYGERVNTIRKYVFSST